MPFSDPMEQYQMIKLDRAEYTRWTELPDGYEFMHPVDRDGEKELLQSQFPHWQIPFERRIPGLTDKGVMCVAHGGRVVGLSYASPENELGLEGYGQIHYAVVHPEHRGHALLAAMVTEMFRRYPDHRGGIFFTDREGHQPMYDRWGGHHQEDHDKAKPAPTGRGWQARQRLGALRRRLFRR